VSLVEDEPLATRRSRIPAEIYPLALAFISKAVAQLDSNTLRKYVEKFDL